MDHSRPAGTRTTSFGSTRDCLRFEAEQLTSPITPEHRRLSALASSIRSENRGSTEDYTAKNLQQLTFGRRTARVENTAASLMHQPILTTVEGLNLIKAEKVYRSQMREPLGRSTDGGVMLPYKFSHGKSSKKYSHQYTSIATFYRKIVNL